MNAPAPSAEEQATIDRFGIFAEERVIEEVARAIYRSATEESDAEMMSMAPTWNDNTEYIHRVYRRLAAAVVTGPLAELLAEVRRGRALREAVERLAADFDANGNGCPLGDSSWSAWHKAARSLRAVVAAVDGEQ